MLFLLDEVKWCEFLVEPHTKIVSVGRIQFCDLLPLDPL